MGRFLLGSALAGIVCVACGGGAAPDFATSADDAAPPTATFSGDAAASCVTDADCPAGQACRTVRIGEVEQQLCVPQATLQDAGGADATSAADAAPGADASGPRDATSGSDAAPPVDAGETDASKPPPDAGQDAGGPTTCSAQLSVTITSSGPLPTCIFNTQAPQDSPATLTYPCAGGAASVTFGSQTFTGTVTNGSVSVTNQDSYTYTVQGVTCRYDSTQTITGTLASGTLSYAYSEVLAPGQPVACKLLIAPCWEDGSVAVH